MELIFNEGANLLWNEQPPEPHEYKGKTTEELLSNVTITDDMINEELKKIDPFKSNIKDCIHPRIIKEISSTITEPLRIIYSYRTGKI